MENLTNFFGGINKVVERDEVIEFLTIKDKSYLDGISTFINYDYENDISKELIRKINDTRKYIFSKEEIIKKDEVVVNCIGETKSFIIRKPIKSVTEDLIAKVTVIDNKGLYLNDDMIEIQLTELNENKYVYDKIKNKHYLILNVDLITEYYLESKLDKKIPLRNRMYALMGLYRRYGKNVYEEIYNYVDDFSNKLLGAGLYEFIYPSKNDTRGDLEKITEFNVYYLSTIPVYISSKNDAGITKFYSFLDGNTYNDVEFNKMHRNYVDKLRAAKGLLSNYLDKFNILNIPLGIENDKWKIRERFYLAELKTVTSEKDLIAFLKNISEKTDKALCDERTVSFINRLNYPVYFSYEPGTENDIIYISHWNDEELKENFILNLDNPSDCYFGLDKEENFL